VAIGPLNVTNVFVFKVFKNEESNHEFSSLVYLGQQIKLCGSVLMKAVPTMLSTIENAIKTGKTSCFIYPPQLIEVLLFFLQPSLS
jgi:hypothetical protein